MKTFYTPAIMSLISVLSFSNVVNAQHTKTKTITIINGDTTISESNIDDKELAEMDKQITIITNEGKDSKDKKVVKKIIINTDKKNDGESMAYAYSMGDDDKDQDITIVSDGNDDDTKIIIKKEDDKKDDSKDKKTIVKKSIVMKDNKKESKSISIHVKDTTAKVDIETSSKEPLNISVLDENGKQVFYDSQKDGSKYSKDIKLDKKGTYFLNMIQDKKSTTEKIVVE